MTASPKRTRMEWESAFALHFKVAQAVVEQHFGIALAVPAAEEGQGQRTLRGDTCNAAVFELDLGAAIGTGLDPSSFKEWGVGQRLVGQHRFSLREAHIAVNTAEPDGPGSRVGAASSSAREAGASDNTPRIIATRMETPATRRSDFLIFTFMASAPLVTATSFAALCPNINKTPGGPD